MIRDKARLLIGIAQVPQQLGQIVNVVAALKLTHDQILDQSSIPAAGAIAGRFRASVDQLTQALALGSGQFRWSTGRTARWQTVIAVEHKGMQPVVDGLLANAQALSNTPD